MLVQLDDQVAAELFRKRQPAEDLLVKLFNPGWPATRGQLFVEGVEAGKQPESLQSHVRALSPDRLQVCERKFFLVFRDVALQRRGLGHEPLADWGITQTVE